MFLQRCSSESRKAILTFAILLIVTVVARGAEESKIKIAISKGQQFLIKQSLAGPEGSLAVLALIKSNYDKKALEKHKIFDDIQSKIQSNHYSPRNHHIYEAGVDAMLLEAANAELYQQQLGFIAKYLMEHQLSNGAWYYPDKLETDCGDTSITQYAILGLWAASRAGVEIPPEVLANAANWHVTRQKEDGGFAYHPFNATKVANYAEFTNSIATMTAAGTSSLLIIRRMLFGDVEMNSAVRPPTSKRRFGVLERFLDESRVPPRPAAAITLKMSTVDAALKNSVNWISSHYGEHKHDREVWYTYHLYTIERIAALMDVDDLTGHDWYGDGSDELIKRQLPDGCWDDQSTRIPATSLSLLFLSKATASVISRKRVSMVGGGLQAGGRGLPENLDSVQMNDGTVSARKIVGAVDNLLIELERSSDAKVEDIQATVVEAIQLDQPEKLIGQIPRLKRLTKDDRMEVRRTALWALGRSEDISAAPLLISALDDPAIDVAREASLALCFLSRRPEGCNLPIDPTEDAQMDLNEDSSDDERRKKLGKWRAESKRRWNEWYLKYRAYDERDDRANLKRAGK